MTEPSIKEILDSRMKIYFHLSLREADISHVRQLLTCGYNFNSLLCLEITLDMKQEQAMQTRVSHQLTAHQLCTRNLTMMAKKTKFTNSYWKFLCLNLQPFRKTFLRYME